MRYGIDEETLIAYGDIIRDAKGEKKLFEWNSNDETETYTAESDGRTGVVLTLPEGFTKDNIINVEPTNFAVVIDYLDNDGSWQLYLQKTFKLSEFKTAIDEILNLSNTRKIGIYFYSITKEIIIITDVPISDNQKFRYGYTPIEMVDEFQDMADNFTPEEDRVIYSGNYLHYNNNLISHFEKYGLVQGDKTIGLNYTNTFNSATKLIKAANIDIRPNRMDSFFCYCTNLEEIDWDTVNIDTSVLNTSPNSCSYMFAYCYKLRYIKPEVLRTLYNTATSASNVPTYNMFQNCFSLDEARKVPLSRGTISSSGSNYFYYFVTNCCRLKTLTFDTNDDGTPLVLKFKGATLEISSYVGYTAKTSYMTSSNYAGLTTATQVTDATTYAALKDNPDYWTTLLAYSRYNKDSALETIQSLPDTSAYGTNTIKFKGTSGSATDGGAINTLTADEIAIATAKGWTVSMA